MARVDNTGVVNVVVQNPSGGVVQRVNVKPGQKVYRGQRLVNLSDTYGGGVASALQLQIAEKNWLMTHANYWDQEKLDEINKELNLNTAWVTQVETNPGRALMGNGDAYTQFQGQQNSTMIETQDVMTNRVQQLTLDSAEANFFSAQIAASLMYPTTPLAGVVEKVYLAPGQVVGAGASVATIRSSEKPVRLTLTIGHKVMAELDPLAMAWYQEGEEKVYVAFDHLPTTPNSGGSYDVTLTLEEGGGQSLRHGDYVAVHLPVLLDTSKGQTVVPLNCVYQTQNNSYAYVVSVNENGETIARQKKVTLGSVVGEYVTILAGVEAGERIIMNNNLLDGQKVYLETE
jgi:multidrug efflux pump subunit AcrA (membrane-fusion protein)